MQEASAELAAALEGDVILTDPVLRAGWHGEQPAAPAGTVLRWIDIFGRVATDEWNGTTRHTWDATVEGWVGEGATSVARVTSPVHDGAGALQATETMGAGFSSLRFNDASGLRNIAAAGPTLKVWVLVPAGAPGTGWQGRIEVQDPAFAWQAGTNFSLTPGEWKLITYTPPVGLLDNCRSIGIDIGATGASAAVSVYIDTMIQVPEVPAPAKWSSATPTLLDVVLGAGTITHNVINSTRGATLEIVNEAGSAYVVDWEVYAVFSANAVPAGAPFSWVIRFADAGGVNWVDLFIGVVQTTNQVYYMAFRNYPTSLSDTLKAQTDVPGVIYTASQKLAVRVAGAGGMLMWKVWSQDLGMEPYEWSEMVTDIRPSFAGKPDFLTHLSPSFSGGTVTFSLHHYQFMDLRVLNDMSGQIGDRYGVSHALDDGFPSAVSASLADSPYGSATVPATGAEDMDARQWFSPFNDDSPIRTYPRDVAPVYLEQGAITANGEERVRIFTGQMSNVPVSGREATVQATSATRDKLRKAVTVPILDGVKQGMEASWLASYLMWASGVEVMPPPDDRGLQFWAPGHGSMRPFVPKPQSLNITYVKNGLSIPRFRKGPFYRALDSRVEWGEGWTNSRTFNYGSIATRYRTEAFGDHWLVTGQTEGRLEFYILGENIDAEYSGAIGEEHIFYTRLPGGALFKLDLMITPGRELQFRVYEWFGTLNPIYIPTGLALPNDGEWHHVGFYYDLVSNEFRGRIDGNERTINPSPAIGLAQLQDVDDGVLNPGFSSAYAWSDLQFYTGQYSDPADYGWNDRLTRLDGAQLAHEDWEDTTYNVTWAGSWARANDQAAFGTWSLKSAATGNYGLSSIWVTVPANSKVVQYWLRTSTELNKDLFQLLAPYVYSNFSSVVSNGWGAPEIGPGSTQWAVTGTASEYASNGTAGTMALTTVSTERMAYFDTGSKDGTITADLTFGVAAATGDVLRLRLRGRGTGANGNNSVYAQIELDTSGDVRLAIQKVVNAVGTTLVGGVLAGSNGGVNAVWRVRFEYSGNNFRATAYNVTSASAPVTVGVTHNELNLTGDRAYISAVRTPANTNNTTVTVDNVILNDNVLHEASGAPAGWRLVAAEIPTGASKLLFRYAKDQSGTGGSDAVWIDSLEFREAPAVTNSFTPQAVVTPLYLDLTAIIEPNPREAWGWISELCQASLTAMRVDELDRLMLLNPSYFIEPDQLAISDTITTEWNAGDPDITLDPSKIRNSVQINFDDTWVDSAFSIVLRFKTMIPLPTGKTQIIFALDEPVVEIENTFAPVFGTNPPAPWPPPTNENGVWINTASDGSGTYLDTSSVDITLIAYTSTDATIEFDNKTPSTVYLVNDFEDDIPYLVLSGKAVRSYSRSVTVSDPGLARRERTLTAQMDAMCTPENARRLASAILFWTRVPRPQAKLSVLGDPRRQPGDRYTLADVEGSEISGEWLAVAITHERTGGQYTQDIVLKEAPKLATWDGTVGWDEGVWSE